MSVKYTTNATQHHSQTVVHSKSSRVLQRTMSSMSGSSGLGSDMSSWIVVNSVQMFNAGLQQPCNNNNTRLLKLTNRPYLSCQQTSSRLKCITELQQWSSYTAYTVDLPWVAFWGCRGRYDQHCQHSGDRSVSQTECLEAQMDTYATHTLTATIQLHAHIGFTKQSTHKQTSPWACVSITSNQPHLG